MKKFILFYFSQRREQTVKVLLKLSEKMDVVDLPKREALVNTEGNRMPQIPVWKVSKVFPVSKVRNAAVAFVIVFRNKFWKWWGYGFWSLCSKPEATVGQMVWDDAATGWMFFLGSRVRNSSGFELPSSALYRTQGGKGWKWAAGSIEKVRLILLWGFQCLTRSSGRCFSLLHTYKALYWNSLKSR